MTQVQLEFGCVAHKRTVRCTGGLARLLSKVFTQRVRVSAAFAFYDSRYCSSNLSADQRRVVQQAYAGLLWSKQFYHYIVKDWLDGDPAGRPHRPKRCRAQPRLAASFNRDVISMPDKWEYPWYAAWDLAFHMIPISRVDRDSPKVSSCSSCANGTCIRTGRSPPTNGIRRCESAGARVGCWRVYKMTRPRGAATALSRTRLSKAADQFHLVGQSQGSTGKHISPAGSSGSTISACSIVKPLPDGGSSSRPMARRGWRSIARRCWRWRCELAQAIGPSLRRHRVEVLRALRRHHRRDESSGGDGTLGRGRTDSTTTSCKSKDESYPWKGALAGRVASLDSRSKCWSNQVLNRLPGLKRRFKWFMKHRPRAIAIGNITAGTGNEDSARHPDPRTARARLEIYAR